MKPRHWIMAMALVASATLVMFGNKKQDLQVVDSVSRVNNTSEPREDQTKSHAEPSIIKLLPRIDPVMGSASAAELFGNQNWNPPPPPPAPPLPPPAPTAPTLPFTYAGKRLVDGAWEVFLMRGDNMIYVRDNSVVEANYRVESIKPPTLTFTYIPLNQRQTLAIGDAE